MDTNEEKIEKIIELFKEQGLLAVPKEDRLRGLLDKINVTDEENIRYKKREVNIISPFNYYMSRSIKVLVAAVFVGVIIGGISYFKLGDSGNNGTKTVTVTEGNSFGQNSAKIVNEGGDDIEALLASLDQEQSEETKLLAVGDIDNSIFTEESALLSEINQTYQNEL